MTSIRKESDYATRWIPYIINIYKDLQTSDLSDDEIIIWIANDLNCFPIEIKALIKNI